MKTPTSPKLNYTKDFCVKSHEAVSANLDFSNVYLHTRISAVKKVHELGREENDGNCSSKRFLSEDLSLRLCKII